MSEPDTVDDQGDVLSVEEIEKMSHRYLVESRLVGEQHEELAKVDVVESYLAPVDFEINGEAVKKGSWVMAVKVHDDALWQAVLDGDITGFSIGGTGMREPIDG